MAMAVFGLGVVVAPIVGPTLGGWLTDQYSWRWAFYINVPVGIVATFLIMRFIEDPPYIRNASPGRIDAIGLGLLAVWLGALQVILDKGQESDWFGAVWIRWMAVLLFVAFAAFLYRELTIRNPIVNLRILSNRNLALGCLLIGLFGAVIYGVITLLPLFYQTLMGYTAGLAGITVSPRGVGAIFIMPIIGYLTSRIDNRLFIAAGFGIFGVTSLWFANLTLGMSQWTMFWPIVISGAASGMVFVPLSTTAMGTLRNEQMGNASGLYNLLRNIGGSIGISMVDTMIARHSPLHRNELAGHLSPGNPIFRGMAFRLQALATSRNIGDRRTAYAILDRLLDQQATAWSYVDDFRYLAIACFACIPIVFMLRKVVGRKGAAAAAH
jgi:DHA2 family multidrug resistance protein